MKLLTLLVLAGLTGASAIAGVRSTEALAASEPFPAGDSAFAAQPPNARGLATKAFLDRIRQYVEFHHNVEKTVPKLKETASPEEISQREAALGTALIARRPDAKEGDFFVESFRPYLIQTIKADFAKRSASDRRAIGVELPKNVRIQVNTVYPTTLPLATFPGRLLAKLPDLPPEVEYRIVGRHLILRDVTGNVIVDIMRDVFVIPN